MKKLLLLSALFIFACGSEDNSTASCNSTNNKLQVGSKSFTLCDALIFNENSCLTSLNLYSAPATCGGGNHNSVASIGFQLIKSSQCNNGISTGNYIVSQSYPPEVGQFNSVFVKTDSDRENVYDDSNGYLSIENSGSGDYNISWNFTTEEGSLVTGNYTGIVENCIF